jgi:hypothetical protein
MGTQMYSSPLLANELAMTRYQEYRNASAHYGEASPVTGVTQLSGIQALPDRVTRLLLSLAGIVKVRTATP